MSVRRPGNKSRNKSPNSKTRARRPSGIEALRGEFKAFGQGLASLNDKIDATTARFETRFDRIDARFDRVEHELGLMKSAVLEHGRQLKEIRVTLDKKVDRDDVEAIVERVVARAAGH